MSEPSLQYGDTAPDLRKYIEKKYPNVTQGPITQPQPGEPAPKTGGRKDDQNKLRFDLIPVRPMELLAEVFMIGARRYADRNWERGLAWGRVYGALQRHAHAWWGGEQRDPDGQHHLASVAWCALALMEYERTHPELDDRKSKAVTAPEPAAHDKMSLVCGRRYRHQSGVVGVLKYLSLYPEDRLLVEFDQPGGPGGHSSVYYSENGFRKEFTQA